MPAYGTYHSLRSQPGIGTPGQNVYLTPLRFGIGPSMPSRFYRPYPGNAAAQYDAMKAREHESYLLRTQLASQGEMQRRANEAALYQQGQYLGFQGRQNALDRVQPRGQEGAAMMMQQQRLEHEAAQSQAEREARQQLQQQLFGHQSQLTEQEWRQKGSLQSSLLGAQNRQSDMDRAAQLLLGRQTLSQQASQAEAERQLREKLGMGELDVERMKAGMGAMGDGSKKPLDPVMMRMFESMLGSDDPGMQEAGLQGLSAAIQENATGPSLAGASTATPGEVSPMLDYATKLKTGSIAQPVSMDDIEDSVTKSAEYAELRDAALYSKLGPRLQPLSEQLGNLTPDQQRQQLQAMGIDADALNRVATYEPFMSADRFDPLVQKTFGGLLYLGGLGEDTEDFELRQRRQQIAEQLLSIAKGQPTAGDNIQQGATPMAKPSASPAGDNRLPSGASNPKVSPGVNDRSAVGTSRSLEELLNFGGDRFADGGTDLKAQLAAQLLGGGDRLAMAGGVRGAEPQFGGDRMAMSGPKDPREQLAESIFGGREPATWSRGVSPDAGSNRQQGLAGPRKMPGLGQEDRQSAPLESMARQQPGPMSRPSDRPVPPPAPEQQPEPGMLDRARPVLEQLAGNVDFDLYEQLRPQLAKIAGLPVTDQLNALAKFGLGFDQLRRFAEYVPTLAADAVTPSTYLPWMLFGEAQEEAAARQRLQGTARTLMQLMQRAR